MHEKALNLSHNVQKNIVIANINETTLCPRGNILNAADVPGNLTAELWLLIIDQYNLVFITCGSIVSP